MKIYNKIFLFSIFFVIISSMVYAYNIEYLNVQSGLNISSIVYDGSRYAVFDIINNTPSTIFNNWSLVRYDTATGTYSRYDQLSVGTTPKTIGYTGTLFREATYIKTYYNSLFYEFYILRDQSGTADYFVLYSRDRINNYWIPLKTFNTACGGSAYTDDVHFNGLSIIDSPNPYNIISIGESVSDCHDYYKYSYGNNSIELVQSFIYGDKGKYVWNPSRDKDSGTEIYVNNTYIDRNYGQTNYSIISNFPINWYDKDNNIFYGITELANFYVSTTGFQNISALSSISCNGLSAYTGIKIHNMDCKDSTHCLIGGEFTGVSGFQGILAEFNGQDCLIIADSNLAGKSINSVSYDEDNDQYFIAGSNILGIYTIEGYTPPVSPSDKEMAYNNFTVALVPNQAVKNIDGSIILGNITGYSGVLIPNDNAIRLTNIQGCNNFPEWVCSNIYIAKDPNKNIGLKVYGTSVNLDPILTFRIYGQAGSYFGWNCDTQYSLKFNDSFTGYTDYITNHGWTTTCGYTPLYDTVANRYFMDFLSNTTCTDAIRWTSPTLISTYDIDASMIIWLYNNNTFDHSDSMIVSFKDASNNYLTPIKIEFNDTTDDILLYYYNIGDATPVPLFNFSGYGGSITLRFYTNYGNKSFSITAEKTNQAGTTKKSLSIPYYTQTTGIKYFDMQPLNSDSHTRIGDVVINTYDTPDTSLPLPFYSTTPVSISCQYVDTGTKLVRFYNNPSDPNALNNYNDWIINKVIDISSYNNPDDAGNFSDRFGDAVLLNGTASFFDDWIGGSSQNASSRFFSAFLIIVVSVLLTMIVGFYMEMPTPAVVGINIFWIVGFMILFTFLGYFPAWVMILMIIIAGGFVAMVLNRMITG